ncbi:hypothetical protein GGR51DRAFT_393449 [Nemania sp. FL0031]|nr:hypothetical protein GGR51DRAFT_393449 [Nemania sp. FL0031]
MADTLKQSMLDSIDAELSKPSSNMLAEAYCATVISNLEGWRGEMLPCTREGRQATIEKLDMRVRRLENVDGIPPPPPMDTPSWDSLMWRVARLHRKMLQGPVTINKLAAAPPHITPTMALLQSTVASIGSLGPLGPQSWAVFIGNDTDLEGDDLLQAAAQYLCYLAGKRNYKITGSFDLKANCKLALDLSLDADANSGFYGGGPRPRMGMRTMPRVGPMGACTCACHARVPVMASPEPAVVGWITRKYYKEKRARHRGVKARICRVFRKLAFWNRNSGLDSDSDASSITTRSSSTCT